VTGRAKLAGQVVAVGVVAALIALLAWKVLQDDGGDAQIGRAAPTFTLPHLSDGSEISLAAYRGKPLVINFFASWCLPCKDEAPVLEQTWRRHRGDGLVVLGIDAQDFRADGRRFAKRFGLTYPIAYDGKGSTLGRYGLTGFPETYFVGRDGRIVAEKVVGGIDVSDANRERFRQGVEKALAEQ
jgi:cytochrome c biogenesis protein CcmG, thiol:disulfide interchange protein DsbE